MINPFKIRGDAKITDNLSAVNVIAISTVSATNTVYANSGNSNNWNNTYTTVSANSANWNTATITSFIDKNIIAYTLSLSDRGKTITDQYGPNTNIYVPATSAVSWTIGDEITIVQGNKYNMRHTVIQPSGVTVYSYQSSLSVAGNWGVVTLLYKGSDVWYLYGDLKPAVVYRAFTVYTACSSVSSEVIYSGDYSCTDSYYGPCFNVGDTVYTDANLTNPFASQTFYYNPDIGIREYQTDAIGAITAVGARCYRTWTSYATCNDYRDTTGSTTDYYTYYADSVLQIGVIIYTDSALTTTANTVTLVINGYVYSTNSYGSVQSVAACVYSLNGVDSCGSLDNTITWYTYSTATTLAALQNNTIYSDANASTAATNTFIFLYAETSYSYTDGMGVLQAPIACPT